LRSDCISLQNLHGRRDGTFEDGSAYIGEFKDNQRHGLGTLTRPDGTAYLMAMYIAGGLQEGKIADL